MDRLWSRVGVRTLAVALLAGGIAGGVHLGQHRDQQQQGAQEQLAMDADAADLQFLKARQNEHAAARAQQREAESDAASKAATEAKDAAGKASSLRQAVADKKKAEKAEKAAKANANADKGTVAYNGPIPGSCKEFVGNRATGCALMLEAGFGIDQFPCLDHIFTKESGWNAHAENKSSGAYGIPQALPGSKMSSVASDWKTNPATQIKWGIGYMKGRYDSPCGAWSHWQNSGNY
ncbi:transglycosylase SLT domain-containing protein [Actinoplanes sp. NPDC051343]|uniref:aggregation-promoting factor C-terminal-like domain-containing protein n=1 Tax=Actinoplanes sp. NPDC051343 TaxID=3363906 RepID=UPI0037B3804D